MKKTTRKDILIPNVGDVVISKFPYYGETDVSEVTDIKYRIRMNPCIKTINHPRWYDVSLIEEIIPKINASILRPQNIYRDIEIPALSVRSKRNVLCGTVPLLVDFALSKLNKPITTTCDYGKARNIYDKCRVGCKYRYRSLYTVDRKKWLKWVEMNYTKFMNSKQHDIMLRQLQSERISEMTINNKISNIDIL